MSDSTIDLTDDDHQNDETLPESLNFQFVDCSSTPTPTIKRKPEVIVNQNSVNTTNSKVNLGCVSPLKTCKPKILLKNSPKYIKIKHISQMKPYDIPSKKNINQIPILKPVPKPSFIMSTPKIQKPKQSQINIQENILLHPPKLAPLSKGLTSIFKTVEHNISPVPQKTSILKNLKPVQAVKPPVSKPVNTKKSPEPKPIQTERPNQAKPVQVVTSTVPPLLVPLKHPTTPVALHTVTESISQAKSVNSNTGKSSTILKMKCMTANGQTQFLKIPPEVLPIINEAKGPVLVDIPGVGPLIFNKLGNVDKAALPKKETVQNVDSVGELIPFSLNFQDILHNNEQKEKKVPKYNGMVDKKYCWQEVRNRKIDLEGFTYYDRNGFSRSEVVKIRKCEANLKKHIAKLEREFSQLYMEYTTWRTAPYKRDCISLNKFKIVEVDKIKKGLHSSLSPSKPKPKSRLPSPEKILLTPGSRNLDAIEIEHDSSTDTAYSNSTIEDNDLMYTKKVVFLKDRKKKRKPKLSKAAMRRQRLMTQYKNPSEFKPMSNYQELMKKYKIKPCFVEVERVQTNYNSMAPSVEDRTTHKIESYTKRQHKNDSPIRKDNKKTTSNSSNVMLTTILNIFNERVINSTDTFGHLMSKGKPMLIIDEKQILSGAKWNFSELFMTYNVIFFIKKDFQFPEKVFRNENFLSAVELGYVKLVSHNVLTQYFSAKAGISKKRGTLITNGRSLINIKKNNGPSTDPCGAPNKFDNFN